jgi:hypothetical protein
LKENDMKCRRRVEEFRFVRWSGNNCDEVVQIATEAGWEPTALNTRKEPHEIVLTVTFSNTLTLYNIPPSGYIVFDAIDGPRQFTNSAFRRHFEEKT